MFSTEQTELPLTRPYVPRHSLHSSFFTLPSKQLAYSSSLSPPGSLEYDESAGSWNTSMYIDPQEGIQSPRFYSLAKHARDMLEPAIKAKLENTAEAVGRLWSVDPEVYETGFFVGPRLFVSRLRLGDIKAAKIESMSVAGYVSIASWGETCPRSALPVKCLWASDEADFGLFLVINKTFRAPGYLELPDDSSSEVAKNLRYRDSVVAIVYNGTPNRNLLDERNALRYRDADEDGRPKVPEDLSTILHPHAKSVASGSVIGLPSLDPDLPPTMFRISASLWDGASGGPVFAIRGTDILLIGMVSLCPGETEGNEASFLYNWHKSKVAAAIKKAQEQQMYLFSKDELQHFHKLTRRPTPPYKREDSGRARNSIPSKRTSRILCPLPATRPSSIIVVPEEKHGIDGLDLDIPMPQKNEREERRDSACEIASDEDNKKELVGFPFLPPLTKNTNYENRLPPVSVSILSDLDSSSDLSPFNSTITVSPIQTISLQTPLTVSKPTPRVVASKQPTNKTRYTRLHPRTLFNDGLLYFFVVAFVLLFGVIPLHPKS
ncbi:7961_t:CDS:2 [Paraglomus brasilianum]|uniref:7961_t:CDS:1 n=1 Tax=Paraglomus brasilianum TaxID=144538 RepID=A0A9N8ZU93_9GLOM|nr:7961_t:CDS:2 [Paraglomus brasilianum]